MSKMRLREKQPTDTLEAQIAVILHHLLFGPFNFDTFRDLSILARNAVQSIETDGKCKSKTLKTDDLIKAFSSAEDTYDNEIAETRTILSPNRLFIQVRCQIVEQKNNNEINSFIKEKNLTCRCCHTWHYLPTENKKYGEEYKKCQFNEVCGSTPACTNIDPIEEMVQ